MTRPEAAERSKATGRVIAHYGIDVEVELDGGERQRLRLKPGSPSLVVGDRVRVAGASPERLPRDTVLQRRDARGRTRAIAANLDVLGITISTQPASPKGYVDRAIVAARSAGIRPFLVVNKCDLVDAAELAEEVRETYAMTAAGIPVFPVSATQEGGLDGLRFFFSSGARGAFIGTSGVGKTSLLNALVPGLDLEVGEINRLTRLGRHVTTRSSLHPLPGGGELIDTPGFRDFVPVSLSPSDLSAYFPGFEEALEQGCHFRNCLHRDEPSCRVVEGVEGGRIDPGRHSAYLDILADLEQAEEIDRTRRRDR